MNLNELIRKRQEKKPPRIVIHGIHGVGKSLMASRSPKPVFIITEDGLTNIEVDHFPLAKSLDDVWQYMKMLIDEDNEYQTVVIDTLDWLERLIFKQVCLDKGVKSISDIGWGKGYIAAMDHWEHFLKGLDALRGKNKGIILLAHNEIKTFSPPDSDEYDRYQIKLDKRAAAIVEEWADLVLFANFKTYVTKNGTKGKATGSGERVLHSDNKPAWRAKSKYDIPDELPLDFGALMDAINGKTTTTEEN